MPIVPPPYSLKLHGQTYQLKLHTSADALGLELELPSTGEAWASQFNANCEHVPAPAGSPPRA